MVAHKDLSPDREAHAIPILPDEELARLVGLYTMLPYDEDMRPIQVVTVRVGQRCVVYKTLSYDDAVQVVDSLKEEIRRGIRRGIRRLTRGFCERCSKGETPKQVTTRRGVYVRHKDNLGWHSCGAEHLWLALFRDKPNKESSNHGNR